MSIKKWACPTVSEFCKNTLIPAFPVGLCNISRIILLHELLGPYGTILCMALGIIKYSWLDEIAYLIYCTINWKAQQL